MPGEALVDVTLADVRLEGTTLEAGVIGAIKDARIERTIDGAPTVTFSLEDTKDRALLNSGIFSSRVTTQVDNLSFELAQIKKAGAQIDVVFEDLVVAALRQHKDPRKVAAGTMSRVDFVKLLAAEEPWIVVNVAPVPLEVAKVELARGNADALPPKATKLPGGPEVHDPRLEDSWTCIKRVMDDIGWRAFVVENQLWLAPETWLIQQPAINIDEFVDGVDEIDYDYDVGKDIATGTIHCEAARWVIPPGSTVNLGPRMGPAAGPWIVSTISRSLFHSQTTVNIIKPRPVLPEPESPQVDLSAVSTGVDEQVPTGDPLSGEGALTIPDIVAQNTPGFSWPVRGTITSGFGPRNGKMHEGLDIACPQKTPVRASQRGTIVFADKMSGYGNMISILHDDNTYSTRYGHITQFKIKRGNIVQQGQLIGLSGGTPGTEGAGDATGPHVHFEIRVNGVPKDPMDFLDKLTQQNVSPLKPHPS